MVMKILFVCTGNTCRSCMAEALAQELWTSRASQKLVEFSSAGVAAYPGMQASSQAIKALAEKNIDLTNHQARLVTPEIVAEADLILGMTVRHVDYITSLVPESKHKTFTLMGYAFAGQQDKDVADPFGGSLEVYRLVTLELETALEALMQRLDHKLA